MLGKKNTIKYDEVRSRYENFRSRCSQSKMFLNFLIKKVKISNNDKKCLGNNNKNNNKNNNIPKGNNKKELGHTNPITGVKIKMYY